MPKFSIFLKKKINFVTWLSVKMHDLKNVKNQAAFLSIRCLLFKLETRIKQIIFGGRPVHWPTTENCIFVWCLKCIGTHATALTCVSMHFIQFLPLFSVKNKKLIWCVASHKSRLSPEQITTHWPHCVKVNINAAARTRKSASHDIANKVTCH